MKRVWQAIQRGGSLYQVILGCFFLTTGALLLFMALTLTPRVSSLLEQNAVDRTRETVAQSTSGLERYVERMIDTLHFASGLLQADTADGAGAVPAQMDVLQKSQQDIQNIAFFGEDGTLLYGTTDTLTVSPADVPRMDWFAQALLRQGAVPYFTAPHVQHLFSGHNEWVVSLSTATDYLADGRVKTGVLLMDFDFPSAVSLASGVSLGSSGYAYIVDAQEAIIYHPRQQLIYAGLAEEDVSAVRAQIVGVCRDEQAGRERVLIIHTIGQTRWRLVGVAYIDEILVLQSAFLRLLTIALACGGLLSIAAATLTATFITRPIHHLQRKMRQVEAGDLNTAITERGFKEIRALSATFNHMIQRIRGLMGQIIEEQEAKRLHELNALQAQINPHFLYNTLDSIIWMEERGRSREAITMVSALARLFRISISKGRNIITVREELEHVRNYLIIQKMRFRDRFTYAIDATPEVLERMTVKLILQPLVENSVHHAIDAYGDHVLHIRVQARLEADHLAFIVTDDGIGIPAQKLENLLHARPGRSGIGLRNVHERIQLTCGKAYGLTIQSEEDEGTTVAVRLPSDLEGEA